jgi:hypothetical protein
MTAKGTMNRLQIREGKLFLSYPTLPPLQCVLMDLDENGCKGSVLFDGIAPGPANEWQKTLAPRRPIHIKLDVAPFLHNFEVDGTVTKVWESAGQSLVELSFHQVSPDAHATLVQAVLALATDKVRQSQTLSRTTGTSVSVPPAPPPSMARPPAPATARPTVPPVPKQAAVTMKQAAPATVKQAAPPAVKQAQVVPVPVPAPQPKSARLKPQPKPAAEKSVAEKSASASSASARAYTVPLIGPVPLSTQEPPVTAPPPPKARVTPPKSLRFETLPPVKAPEEVLAAEEAPAPDPDRFSSKKLERAAVTMPTAGTPSDESLAMVKSRRLGEVLVHMGRLTNDQIEQAVNRARASGERLGRYLLRTGMLAPDVLCRALALQTGLPMTDLHDAQIPESLSRVFTHELLMQYNFVPFDEAKTFVCIAVADPLPPQSVKDLERMCGKRIEVFLAQEDLVVKMLDKARGKHKHKLRKHIRYEIQTMVRYQFCSRLGNPAEDIIHNGTTLNVSEGGFLIEGSPTALGGPEDLRRRGICARVVLSSAVSEITTICHLRSIRQKERQEAGRSRWLLGLEIAEISTDDRRRLKEMCLKALQDRIKESD